MKAKSHVCPFSFCPESYRRRLRVHTNTARRTFPHADEVIISVRLYVFLAHIGLELSTDETLSLPPPQPAVQTVEAFILPRSLAHEYFRNRQHSYGKYTVQFPCCLLSNPRQVSVLLVCVFGWKYTQLKSLSRTQCLFSKLEYGPEVYF